MAERLSPAQIHLRTISAAVAHAAETEDLSDFTEYEKMCRILARHRKDLKNIQSTERKGAFKKQILPDYLPWIEGALSVGSGKQDNVLMTWCVWAIDCGEYHLALQIADYAVFHDLRLPEPFTRTLGTLLAEEFADQAKAAQAANKPFEVAYLEQVQRITADCDMPDESRARLLRELGLLLVEKNPEQALAYLERALGLDQKIGVKIVTTGAASFSFEYRYTLNVVVTDYAGDIATLIVPMMAYLRTNQPEILENPQIRENAFKFQVDYNNNNTADISFEIQLTERVVSKKDGNNVQIHYAKEPVWDEPNRVKVYLENWDSLIFEGDIV